jgi:hypothetical protein
MRDICDRAIYDDVYETGFLESDLNETSLICGFLMVNLPQF